MARSKNPRTFKVRGAGRFPIDMLRYDSCWPASSEDSRLIAQSIAEPVFRATELTEITLTIAPGYTDPSFKRWSSFGWFADTPY